MDELVLHVKSVQRQQGGKELWNEFVLRNGGGKRDPASKSPEILAQFLSEATNAGFSSDATPSTPKPSQAPRGRSNRASGERSSGGTWVNPAEHGKGGNKGKQAQAWGGVGAQAGGWGGTWVHPMEQLQQQQMLMMMQHWMPHFAQQLNMQQAYASAAASSQPADLVSLVKRVQKKPGGYDAWQKFIDKKGGGKRDPSARSDVELEQFLKEVDPDSVSDRWPSTTAPGERAKSASTAAKNLPSGPEHAHAIARVKAIQKEGGHDAWTQYTERIGAFKRDPAAHSLDVLLSFLAEVDPENQTAHLQSSFDELEWLISKIKQGQRSSEEFKQAWYEFVQTVDDIRDPAKHAITTLKAFMKTAPSLVPPLLDDEHLKLVNHIKEGQRSSPEFKEAWWKFCESRGQEKHDPARHDANFLRDFLSQRDLTESQATAEQGGPVASKRFVNRWNPY